MDFIFSGAKYFAEFSEKLTPITDEFVETIPHFHDLRFRYDNYQKSLKNALPERLKSSEEAREKLEKFSWIVEKFDEIIPTIPKRIFHHDAKVNNILFKKNSHEVLGLIDLDTIMPGYIFSDFGDMVWSWIFSIDHNAPAEPEFDEQKYNTLAR